MNPKSMSRKLLCFFYLLSVVVGFHNIQIPFASRNLNPCRDVFGSSSCIAASKSNDSPEDSIESWVATSKTVVSTFVLGWTLAASVAMAQSDVVLTATVDDLVPSTPELNVVVDSGERNHRRK